MLDIYEKVAKDYLALPVIKGEKTASERFPGAVNSFTLEAMMQDRKALQAGTSHFLGQNFAKASDITYQSAQEREEYAWTTSWGVSTRLIGAIIMTHSDDNGLVLPPMIASSHVVLMPIAKKPEHRASVMDYTHALAQELRDISYHHRKIMVEIDEKETGGRAWDWIKKGIPLRVEIGPRDIAQDAVFVGRRDRDPKDRESIGRQAFVATIGRVLDDIQGRLFDRAMQYRDTHTAAIDSKDAFYRFFTPRDVKQPEIHGGFAYAHWCGGQRCEEKIKDDLSVTIRCIPLEHGKETGACLVCGGKSDQRVVFAKAY
jgi:prolyl-tRNA synthetase